MGQSALLTGNVLQVRSEIGLNELQIGDGEAVAVFVREIDSDVNYEHACIVRKRHSAKRLCIGPERGRHESRDPKAVSDENQ